MSCLEYGLLDNGTRLTTIRITIITEGYKSLRLSWQERAKVKVCVWVCMYVCVRVRERERERKEQRVKG